MPLLSLEYQGTNQYDRGLHFVRLVYQDGPVRHAANKVFVRFDYSAQDEEDLRWYLEEYLENRVEPAPALARRVEGRIGALGKELSAQLFNDIGSRSIWRMARLRLPALDIVVRTDAKGESLPWELLTDPGGKHALAVVSRSFTRVLGKGTPIATEVGAVGGPIRILLVVARPDGAHDVSFHTIGDQLIRLRSLAASGSDEGGVATPDQGVGAAARKLLSRARRNSVGGRVDAIRRGETPVSSFTLQMLRPPTLEGLQSHLLEAKNRGEPYDVVHIDAHGVRSPSSAPGGARGYVYLEDPDSPRNRRLVDGNTLGDILARCGVRILVVSACGSGQGQSAPRNLRRGRGTDAHRTLNDPGDASDTSDARIAQWAHRENEPVKQPADAELEVAYGSFASEASAAGVPGVVAMRFSLFVSTAERLIPSFYRGLLRGRSLGVSVSDSRAYLANDPVRWAEFHSASLQDWTVPIVYGERHLSLRRAPPLVRDPRLNVVKEDEEMIGRSEDMFTLDRAVRPGRVVLLHGMAGVGKSVLARRFARWAVFTGTVGDAPIAISSAAPGEPLPASERERIRRLFGSGQGLWVCDGLTVTPGGLAVDAEWQATFALIQTIAQAGVAVLIVSRSSVPELAASAERIRLWLMPRGDQTHLARIVETRLGPTKTVLIEVDGIGLMKGGQFGPLVVPRTEASHLTPYELAPLMRLAHGVPSVLIDLVARSCQGERSRQACDRSAKDVRDGRESIVSPQLEVVVAQMMSSFTSVKRTGASLLHLFQDYVGLGTLEAISDPQRAGLEEVRNIDEFTWAAILQVMRDAGLMTGGGGSYYPHPALRQLLRPFFLAAFPDASRRLAADQAYAEVIGIVAAQQRGRYTVRVNDLWSDAENMKAALEVSLANQWWEHAHNSIRGLEAMSDLAGATPDWGALISAVAPHVTREDGGPIPGREDLWHYVGKQFGELAFKARRYSEADDRRRKLVEWSRLRARSVLDRPPETWSETDRGVVRTLADDIRQWGHVRLEQGDRECFRLYDEAWEFGEKSGWEEGRGAILFGRGGAYTRFADPGSVEAAEDCYERCLALLDPQDGPGRAQALANLANIGFGKAVAARRSGDSGEAVRAQFESVHDRYLQARQELPANAKALLVQMTHNLGMVEREIGLIDEAIDHLRKCCELSEETADWHFGALARRLLMEIFADQGRMEEATIYADAAASYMSSAGPHLDQLRLETERWAARQHGTWHWTEL